MAGKRIFIHIPKTGGTTLDCAINGTDWMQKHDDFHYRHIRNDTKLSNAGDIFKAAHFQKYQAYDIFTMLRHPVDRLISEYYFVRDRKEFFSLINKRPRNLEEYAKNTQTRNYMLAFLLGQRIYSKKPVEHFELEHVKKVLDGLPIYVGIFEEFDKSLQYLSSKLGIKFPKKIDVKRITLNRPTLDMISDETKEIITERNDLDMQLYRHCKQKLDAFKPTKSATYSISRDKYSYVMKYTERFILATLFMRDKKFLARNEAFFKQINFALHRALKFHEGKRYVQSWNSHVVETIATHVDDQLKTKLRQIVLDSEDPLESTKQICKEISTAMRSNRKFSRIVLKFDQGNLKIAPAEKRNASFLKRLFN